MLTAIVADVHSNPLALRRVLQDARRQHASSVWFLGDLVGYGADPYRAWDTLLTNRRLPCEWALAGNHDWGLVGRLGGAIVSNEDVDRPISSEFNHVAWSALHKNIAALQDQQNIFTWLREQPLVVSPRANVYLAHGAFDMKDPPKCLLKYVRKGLHAEESWHSIKQWLSLLPEPTVDIRIGSDGWQPPRLMIVGHWHRQLVWRRQQAGEHEKAQWYQLLPDFGAHPEYETHEQPVTSQPTVDHPGTPQPQEVSLSGPLIADDPLQPTIINPGSVGIPRDGANAGEGWAWAKYALIDWTPPGARVRFRHVPYELKSFLKILEQLQYPAEIARWLKDV
jgi:predicted phosphodiesterase